MGRHHKPTRNVLARPARTAAVAGALGMSALQLFSPALASAAGPQLVDGTPCTVTAKACVDLDNDQAWLIKDGHVIKGPVDASPGGRGNETPRGTFHVVYKDKDHVSHEYLEPDGTPAPMPYSVFFDNNGRAFHQGNLDNPSGGCVRLSWDDAKTWFDTLQVGDEVQIV